MKHTFLILFNLFCITVFAQNKIKVACIGASITYGARIDNREQNSYPAQLQKMLGNTYQVTNYGVSGATLLRKGDRPYWATSQYQQALTDQPDVVLIDLGGNDAKLINRTHLNEYEADYHDLIKSFTDLPSHPRVILMLAMPSFVKDSTGIFDPVIVKQVNPRIQKVAYADKVEVLDMHALFMDKESLMADKIHPDKEGAGIIAKAVYDNLAQIRDKDFDIFSKLDLPLKRSSFYGYNCADFTFNGRACKIAQPKIAAKGHPWIWRARFWGHEPQTDIALLQRGFHVVYCDVAEMMGNDTAVNAWNNYYSLLHKAGLNKKAAMEGMSRGGVYVFNWAAVNKDKVAGVYVDNPLLNMQGWSEPYMADSVKKTGLYTLFVAFKNSYNLSTNQQVRAFKGSPTDKVKQIVAGHYPILVLCADNDEAVSPQNNTLLFEKEVKELGGNITVVHKPGFKHHPHSLPNPTPIVNFILKATGNEITANN
jgi:lysophospholipase L1-like esterase